MSEPDIIKHMRIRYIKLHFELEMLEGGHLPRNKASMLRGGMGQMLLMTNCIRDEKCDACDFYGECLVQRMMYPRMKIRPSFMTQKDSEGYVLECENTDEDFYEGDLLEFNLILFGDSIVYFNQFLQAFHALGMRGLGREHLRFRISRVTNTNRELLLADGILYKEHYQIRQVGDYVKYRLRSFERVRRSLAYGSQAAENDRNMYGGKGQPLDGSRQASGESQQPHGEMIDVQLIFHSPLSLKYKGEFQNTLDPLPVLAAAERRLYIMNCYEGFGEMEDSRRISLVDEHVPQKIDEKSYVEKVKRYSGTHDAKMVLSGLKGSCRLSGVDQTALALLLAGELMHIGKNTSFGFGRYTVRELPRDEQ